LISFEVTSPKDLRADQQVLKRVFVGVLNSDTEGNAREYSVLQHVFLSSGNTSQTHLLESQTAALLRCVQFFPHHEIFRLSRSFVQETKKNYMIGRQLASLI
jgi:hypothetical protein